MATTSNPSPPLSSANPPELVVYSREGCHLCEDMISGLQQWQERECFSFEVVDVDSDPNLRLRYGERVPVLIAGEKEICHYHLDPLEFGKLFSSPS
jgi:hypothetical protein